MKTPKSKQSDACFLFCDARAGLATAVDAYFIPHVRRCKELCVRFRAVPSGRPVADDCSSKGGY